MLLSEYRALGDRLLCAETGPWLTDCDVICALEIEVLWGRGNLCQAPQILLLSEEKQMFLSHVFLYFSQETQLHYNLMTPLSHMGFIVDQNIVMLKHTIILCWLTFKEPRLCDKLEKLICNLSIFQLFFYKINIYLFHGQYDRYEGYSGHLMPVSKEF